MTYHTDDEHDATTDRHTIIMRIYVRSAVGKRLPTRREVENKVSDLLLGMPRLDEDGVDWDVSATSIPGEDDLRQR
jgi:hypothetical protein